MGWNRIDRMNYIMNNVRATQLPSSDPLWMKQVLSDLERHESYREYAYPDPLSQWGKMYPAKVHKWGFRPASVIMAELGLSISNAGKGAPWTVGIGFTHGVKYTSRTTRAQSYQRLRQEVIDHAVGLDHLIAGWRKEHNVPIQTVLVNMIYNMGTTRLSKFAPTLSLIAGKKYKEAADRIRKTAYFRQTGSRAKELVERLETAKIQDKYKI